VTLIVFAQSGLWRSLGDETERPGDQLIFVVADRCGDTAQADLRLFIVISHFMAANFVEFFCERVEARQRMRRLARQTGTTGIGAHSGGAVGSEKQFAHGSQVQGCPATHQIDDTYQRATARSPFDVDDLVVVANAEIDGFANALMQLLHVWQGDLADVDPRLDQIAEFEQPDTERVAAAFVALDDRGAGHRRQDPVCR
jgi:hypothetical protein